MAERCFAAEASMVPRPRPGVETASPETDQRFAHGLGTDMRWRCRRPSRVRDPPLSEEAARRERDVSGRRGGLTPSAPHPTAVLGLRRKPSSENSAQ